MLKFENKIRRQKVNSKPKHVAVFRFSITKYSVSDGFLLVPITKSTVGNKEKLINRETETFLLLVKNVQSK